jgi:hypothetical protein
MENIKNSLSLINAKWNDEPRIFKCYFCDITRQKYLFIQKHMLEEHPHETFFNCDYVACVHLFFTSEEEKNKHMEEQHESTSDERKVLRCVYCDRVFLRGINFRSHMKEAHRQTIVRCTHVQCNKYLKSEADRQRHMKEEHFTDKKLNQCVYCKKMLPNYKSLWSHMKYFHLNTMKKCIYKGCVTYFKKETDRQQHVEEMHQPRKNAKMCIYCGKWVNSVTRHIQYFHTQDAIKCNYTSKCSTFFKSEIDREEHIKKVHLAGKIKQIVECIFCGKTYSKRDFGDHIKSMHKGMATKCSHRKCGQYFKNKEECEKHFNEYHQKEEKLQTIFCPQCSYKTNNETLLRTHSRNMHGKERLKCAQCPESEKTYKSKQLLKQHISFKHPSVLKICPHCNLATSMHGLWAHLVSEHCSVCKIDYLCRGTMQEHTKWCKQKCDICLREYSGSQLLKHVTNVHKIVDVEKLTWIGDLRNLKKNLKCEQCERCFYNLNSLSRHVKMTHGESKKLLSCDHCKKQLQTRCNMERHMLLAHGGSGKAQKK